jgi:hypothetical protein
MIVIVTIAEAAPAFAVQYALEGCKFAGSGNALKWKDNTTRVGYSGPAATSVTAWNSATTHVTLTLVTTGANVNVNDGNFGPTINGNQWDGVTYLSTCSGGYWTATANSWWNRYYTDAYASTERQSVMVHEIGHALGLDHYTAGTCPNVQIMQTDTYMRYDFCAYSTPQSGDVAGVNTMY